MSAASVLVTALAIYFALGALFAPAFALWGCQRIDPAARTGTRGFRLLILPGAAALWPLLLARWLAGTGAPPRERNAHRDAAGPASPPPHAERGP